MAQQRAMSVDVVAQAEALIADHAIMIFSKTTCPFCQRVKALMDATGVAEHVHVVELNEVANGAEMQAALLQLTGQRTVPNVFVRGTHVGGHDDTVKAIQEERFLKMLEG